MKIRGVAHRGYPVKYPENTLAAFQAAADLNFTHVELDVHLSKDGVPVLMHDYSIDRTTDGKGLLREYTLKELKQAGDTYPGLEEKVLEVVRRTGMQDHARLISFDHFALIRARELDSEIRLGALCSGSLPHVFPFLKELDCDFLGINVRFMTPEYGEMIADHGVINAPWPIETLEEMERIAKHYPTALITTNHLERWAEFYQQRPELHL